MDIITYHTKESIRTLTSKLYTLKITSIKGENVRKAISQLRGAYRCLVILDKVFHDISDRLIKIFRNTSVEEFNSSFKTMKDNICIKNLRIAKITYMEIENGLWTGVSTIQESGFVINTTFWNCGGKGHKAPECPSKKTRGNAKATHGHKLSIFSNLMFANAAHPKHIQAL